MKKIMIFASALALVACGGSKDDSQTQTEKQWRSDKQTLVYSYPTDGQLEVPNSAPVVLSFSSAISATHPEEHITVTALSTGEVVPVTAKQADSGTSLVLTPEKRFHPLEEYQVDVGAINLEEGVSKPQTLRFNTRGLAEGPAKLMAKEQFEVVRRFPDGTEQLPVVDFSSFRYQFSQPIAVETARYGEQITLLDASDSVVEAEVLVHGAYLTIDPKEDLQPNTQYTLAIDGLQSTQEQSYSDSWSFTPKDTTSPTTGKREKLVQEISANGEGSPLTGNTINKVPMASVLLGEGTATQASGVLEAELAFVPHFPDVTPFRIAKGSLIKGSDIEVLIGGLVPAGFNSGDIRMHFISDATGYLMPNAYSDQPDAPRHVRLFMDMAISAETDKANGAITQDLMHIELAGTAIVEDGSMVINAVGVVEPNVLGSEYASGLLSFYMKSFEDQVNPPEAGEDDRPLVLQTWIPGEAPDAFLENDPVVLQFNKPINKQIESSEIFNVFENGIQLPSEELIVTTSGSNIYLNKKGGWNRSLESEAFEYRIELASSDAITDIFGIAASTLPEMEFDLSTIVESHIEYMVMNGEKNFINDILPRHAAVILAAHPGYPCLVDFSSMDLANDIVGSCDGTLNSSYKSHSGNVSLEPSDLLPLITLPENKPITLIFSKNIDPNTVLLNDSFIVEEVDKEDLSTINLVEGRLQVQDKKIIFMPDKNWQKDALYRYTVKSAEACVEHVVCTVDELPVQTKLYSVIKDETGDLVVTATDPLSGGEDFSQLFRGGDKTESVFLTMTGPTADVNANFYHDYNYLKPKSPDVTGGYMSVQTSWSEYEVEEIGVNKDKVIAKPHAVDPNGLEAPVNSAKILSTSDPDPMAPVLTGLHVGCSWEASVDEPMFAGARMECPENKFTYLTSSLVIELTGKQDPDKGVEVKVYPGQIMATSLTVYTTMNSVLSVGVDTGPQVMRMRFSENEENGQRVEAITGWIAPDTNGNPELAMQIDLYIDALALTEQFAVIGLAGLNHNLINMPISLELSGLVSFTDSGRMITNLRNANEVKFPFELELMGGTSGEYQLFIPENGVNLQLLGDVIKSN